MTKNVGKHTPTPFIHVGHLQDALGYTKEDAEFIYRAVNSHEALLEALKDVLRSPGIDDTDQVKGETFRFLVNQAIAKAEGE